MSRQDVRFQLDETKLADGRKGDTGVARALLGIDARALASDRALLGQLVETGVETGLLQRFERDFANGTVANWRSTVAIIAAFNGRCGASAGQIWRNRSTVSRT